MSSIIAWSSPFAWSPASANLWSGTRVSTLPSDGEAERVREPPRRVDGAHERAAARERAIERDRRGDRGLADAARADADDDPPARRGLAHGGHGPSSGGAAAIAAAIRSTASAPHAATGSSGSTVVGRSSAARARAR